ncbi:chemotaxis signal transduction protein CheV [Acutalibacter sp. 1XD8-33]|uniref:chemotaxis protein n=1 Tax=Acutalibacter sp. 1XD8-33 TaxID=2320081 RepID=UPI000EA0BE7A|nr:chemotaxis protein [Acutalibacter sp. 1XD8-33]RKJ42115.1 chemotaxis signal transduction protein CheV [Acutalibacter sp. 1XD8-33]
MDIMRDEILLESGTNEIQILEFTIDGVLYGINVAKVRQITISEPVKFMPHTHEAVEGIFKPRDEVITVINLPRFLGSANYEPKEKDMFVLTGFNKMTVAFRVHTVEALSRISWKGIQKPDTTINGGNDGVATGIAQCGDDLVTILDFERIVAEIAPETSIKISEIDALGPRERNNRPIVIAEDSILLSHMIKESLTKAGYTNLRMFPNGHDLWIFLSACKKENTLDENAALIVTDIEMPQMDGHRLTKLVKDDPEMKHIPLIIFSSLISEEMRIKGKELGADEQMSKPEIGRLVNVMDALLVKKEEKAKQAV